MASSFCAHRVSSLNGRNNFFEELAEEIERELREAGFAQIEQVDSKQLNALYFAGRADGLKLPDPGLGMLVTAWV